MFPLSVVMRFALWISVSSATYSNQGWRLWQRHWICRVGYDSTTPVAVAFLNSLSSLMSQSKNTTSSQDDAILICSLIRAFTSVEGYAGAEESDKINEIMFKNTTKAIQKQTRDVEEGGEQSEQQLPKRETVDHWSKEKILVMYDISLIFISAPEHNRSVGLSSK